MSVLLLDVIEICVDFRKKNHRKSTNFILVLYKILIFKENNIKEETFFWFLIEWVMDFNDLKQGW